MEWLRSLRLASAFVTVVLVSAACGGAAAPSGTGGGKESPPSEEPFTFPPVVEGTGSGDSGATIRVVNVWAEPGKPGPTVRLRVYGNTELPPLVEAAPGTVSDFVAIPKAQFGEGAADVEVIRADAGPEDSGISTGSARSGDRITVIVHGELQDSAIGMALHTTWEVGEPVFGLPWPSTPPDKATLMVYPGALLTLPVDVQGIALAESDGTCLITADTGEEETGGFGGNVSNYYTLDAGSTEIAVAHSPSGTCQLEPTIGKVTVQASGGQRFALIPWGQGGDQIELLLLDMGAP